LGELLPGAKPMMHALKLEFFANLFYYRPLDGNKSNCYHWPATNCDGYAFDCTSEPQGCYNGTNPNFTPGALLAIPPSIAENVNASLKTEPAKALLFSLVNFGGYIVDDTFWNATSICTEHGVQDEFEAAYGYPYRVQANANGSALDWYNDQLTLFRALSIVVNNAPNSQGGGGVPRQELAPPFC
jgi:hypothetical protein